MTTRADTIAAVLRRPALRRPIIAHELRERLVQGLGPGTTVATWTATVPQLAEAIDTALQKQERKQKDTPAVGNQLPAGTADTARAEILRALQNAGHNQPAALELLARAFREPHTAAPGHEFVESLAGGHALVLECGDRELIGSCQCGRRLGRITSLQSTDALAGLWERHTITEVS